MYSTVVKVAGNRKQGVRDVVGLRQRVVSRGSPETEDPHHDAKL